MNSVSWQNYIKDRPYAKNLNLKNIVLQFKLYLEELEKEYMKRK